jgi:2-polyprenyl-3-methyl-5-hydroxy-6-metoxy-1,4-benzoquinol methylase
VVVVHRFTPDQIDNNIGYYVANELLPLLDRLRGGAPRDSPAYGEHELFGQSFAAVVRSIDANEQRAWRLFYDNTLAALRQAMAAQTVKLDFIGPFGAIYRRVVDLLRGQTLLDAGTSMGFMPLLLASREPVEEMARLAQIVGFDSQFSLIQLANAYAAHRRLDRVRFVVADLLADDGDRLGVFDTVTAIHVLEHLDAGQTEPAVANLWRHAGRRLIIAVPLERTPDARYGHRQVFDQARLTALGRRLEQPFRYFEHQGGWLVVDRE